MITSNDMKPVGVMLGAREGAEQGRAGLGWAVRFVAIHVGWGCEHHVRARDGPNLNRNWNLGAGNLRLDRGLRTLP